MSGNASVEALLHEVTTVYQEGDVTLARELLTRAIEESGDLGAGRLGHRSASGYGGAFERRKRDHIHRAKARVRRLWRRQQKSACHDNAASPRRGAPGYAVLMDGAPTDPLVELDSSTASAPARRRRVGRRCDPPGSLGRRYLHTGHRGRANPGRFVRVSLWHGARLEAPGGPAFHDVRTPMPWPGCALPNSPRSCRDLSGGGRQSPRWRGPAPVRRAGVQ